jgi:hypothetical protein
MRWGVAGGVTALTGGAILVAKSQVTIQSVASLVNHLATFHHSSPQFTEKWNTAQVFNHLAQSVEFSMQGFPEPKSELFQNTLGKAAFNLFRQQGKMHHNLNEVIPGAPFLDPDAETKQALDRLIVSLNSFMNYSGKLAPHFAFGYLTHQQYQIAHVLHIEDHLRAASSF